jgi:hypothetical protein
VYLVKNRKDEKFYALKSIAKIKIVE